MSGSYGAILAQEDSNSLPPTKTHFPAHDDEHSLQQTTSLQLKRFLSFGTLIILAFFALALCLFKTHYNIDLDVIVANRDNGPPTLACSRGLPPDGGITGYFQLPSNKNLNYFYYFAASKNTPMEDAPLLIWMSGGPGCSSLLASYMENGPCRVSRNNETKDPETTINEYSWNENANVVWVDQPADVGLSFGDDGNSTLFSHREVSANMLAFLHRWQQRFPDSHNGELFIFAESFGGHYAPAVARAYFDAEVLGVAPPGLKLAGFGVGNGLTNPKIQYKYAATFANNNTYGIKSVSDNVYSNMKHDAHSCVDQITKCNDEYSLNGDEDCMAAFMYCNEKLQMPFFETGRNIYDIRTFKSYNDKMAVVSEFVNQHFVREALDADNDVQFVACNMKVYMRFLFDWMKEYEDCIPLMLENGVDVLIYAGDADFILNWMGNEAWVRDMEWVGKDDFNSRKESDFVYRNENGVGTVGGVGRDFKLDKEAGRLTFLRVLEAGHLAPKDQPVAMLEMINRFTKREAIIEKEKF